MLFIPYKADLQLARWPVVTVLVCLLCVAIYYQQERNEELVLASTEAFCVAEQPHTFTMVLRKLGQDGPQACAELMLGLHLSEDRDAFLRERLLGAPPVAGYASKYDSDLYLRGLIEESYASFRRLTPDYLTHRLWYEPASWNPLTMVTAAFAHGSWGHVAGNLFFFFAFGATLELIIGSLAFPLVLLGLAVGSHAIYSLANLGVGEAVPTVGFSGVVTGAIALFAFFLPRVKIRCFLWVLVFFLRFGIPAWLLASWFIGWDVYTLLSGEDTGGVNIVAHVGGAAVGYALGVLFYRERRREIRAMLYAESY